MQLSRIFSYGRSLTDILTLAELPRTVPTLLSGASIIVTVFLGFPLPLQLVVYLGTMVVLYVLWIVSSSRVRRVRKVRSLFKEAARRFSKSGELEDTLRESIERTFEGSECDVLLRMALKPQEVTKFENDIDMREWRAVSYGKSFSKRAAKSEMFGSLATKLTYSMIDGDFPEFRTLDEFPGPGFRLT